VLHSEKEAENDPLKTNLEWRASDDIVAVFELFSFVFVRATSKHLSSSLEHKSNIANRILTP
jgi:hypothetical protein